MAGTKQQCEIWRTTCLFLLTSNNFKVYLNTRAADNIVPLSVVCDDKNCKEKAEPYLTFLRRRELRKEVKA